MWVTRIRCRRNVRQHCAEDFPFRIKRQGWQNLLLLCFDSCPECRHDSWQENSRPATTRVGWNESRCAKHSEGKSKNASIEHLVKGQRRLSPDFFVFETSKHCTVSAINGIFYYLQPNTFAMNTALKSTSYHSMCCLMLMQKNFCLCWLLRWRR